MMKKITVHTPKEYDIRIGSGAIAFLPEFLREKRIAKAAVVGEQTAKERLRAVSGLLGGFDVTEIFLPSGEEEKSFGTLEYLLDELAGHDFSRSDVLIAVGGGSTGDLCGFAASVYKRGMCFIQIPTTLLAMVDSSIGGKNAVSTGKGKNIAGTVYQPDLVICDTGYLQTLPESEFRHGMAEIVKYGMIASADFFRTLENGLPETEELIAFCAGIKADYVEKDEFDTGIRKMLNFGHTVGHAFELVSGYTVPHGDAVAVGMAVLTKAAESAGKCEKGTTARLCRLLEKYGLPTVCEYPAEAILSAAAGDKKADGSGISLVIPEAIGKCTILRMTKDEMKEFLLPVLVK